MDNYEAIAYACVALNGLEEENKEINETTLKNRMLYLMDLHSESEIYSKYEKMSTQVYYTKND